ncbi:MAG: ribosome-associated translation inhibitor RaiA [Elusimicrobia bacterium]|nr:ribosome-associated translation inhibitor RaiA [Elusimicrobiota bacterium]
MKIHLTARRLKITEPIERYVMQKLEKAERYFDHLVWAQVVLFIEKRTHKAEIIIHGARQTFRALAAAGDLYSAIDLASDKMDKQIKKYKDRLRDHHKAPEAVAAPAAVAAAVAPPLELAVVKTAVSSVTAQEAASRLDESGQKFLLFEDKDSKQIHVIYRRDDDSYCVVQPIRKK